LKDAAIWGWGEEPELAGENAERYIHKRWRVTTKECAIRFAGKSTEEGAFFWISAYTGRKPENLKSLVDDTLSACLGANGKVYSITIGLYDSVTSDEERHRDSLQAVEEAYRRRRQNLAQAFMKRPEVKALLEGGKQLVVISPTSLLCEMKSKWIDKLTVDVGNYYLEEILSVLHRLTNKLIEYNVANGVLGYGLREEKRELRIEELYVEEGKVYLQLEYPPAKR